MTNPHHLKALIYSTFWKDEHYSPHPCRAHDTVGCPGCEKSSLLSAIYAARHGLIRGEDGDRVADYDDIDRMITTGVKYGDLT